jgi:hypothetical protein
MCIFSGSVDEVSSTRIFARKSDSGRQLLVYSMAFAAAADVAMVLPLPVPSGSAEKTVRFIDLSGYPKFFSDLDRAFPRKRSTSTRGAFSLGLLSLEETLVVHEVGSCEASFVPTRDDFSRLDPRFRLSDDVWQALPGYADWGFAVFKLGQMAELTGVHPMAFEFPQRNPDQLFFPTVHVHNGRIEPWAAFDHRLYCQDADESRLDRWYWSFHSEFRWEQSSVALSEVMVADRAEGTVRPDRPCHRVAIRGSYANADVVV